MSDGPYTVLVVEDEPWIRLALVHHLEELNFQVREAASFSEAVAELEHPGVDLVFTDLRLLGERDGIELARWVARNLPGISVVLTSGEMGHATGFQELCRAEGFTSFGKPYAHADVSAQILELINKKRRDAGAGAPP